jgi:hypothetical protein
LHPDEFGIEEIDQLIVTASPPSQAAKPLPDHPVQVLHMVGQSLTDEQIEAAVNKARKEWRAKCDEHNQWCDLGDDEKFLLVARAIESAVRAHGDDWLDMLTAPKEGEFLVYLPHEKRKIQSANRTKNGIFTIGGQFEFDVTVPTNWRPQPPPPNAQKEKL